MDSASENPLRRSTTRTSDFLQLDVGEAPAGGLSDWLARRLRAAIADGLLPEGAALPTTRGLAAELHVSRGVITEAYRRLADDGHVAGRGRAGTVVVATPVPAPARPAPQHAVFRFASEPGADVFDAVRAAPARLDLSPGLPDLAAFPRAAWSRAERAVLGALEPSDFGYGDPRGTPALRMAIAHRLARTRGIRVDPDDVLVVAGVAQALGLIAEVLSADGITEMAVEDPGSLGVRQHLHHGGLTTPPVPVDGEGIRVDELRSPAVMLTPAHQFPTGVVLSGSRRRDLLRWDGLVVEDDYDAEHRYDRPPVAAMRSLLPERVVYTGSVSKLLAPALRIGWVLAPPRYRDAFVEAKRFADLGNAALPQLVLARLMESGELDRHLRLLRGRHRARRDAMVDAIAERLPGTSVHGAAAGLHLLVTFDAGLSDINYSDINYSDIDYSDHNFSDVDLAAAALAQGVKVHPLSWHAQRPRPPGLVLGYAARTPSDIAEAIAVLARLV